MFKPLKGIKVLDLTTVLAGPYCTYQLALLGAEIIKIEKVGEGDWTRYGTFDKKKDLVDKQMGSMFLIQNSDKKSIQIDLKTKKGQQIVKKLLIKSDIFVENMSPGKANNLGLGWEEVKKINKKIIYCSISAFGQDGPYAARGAYDHVIQGMSGIMHLTGTEESGPTKVGAPYIDYATGLNAAFAITSALTQDRETRKAVRLDVAMLDTSLLLMANMVSEHINSGWQPRPMGNEASSQSPSSGSFETKSTPILLAANTDEQFLRLCDALEKITAFEKRKWLSEEFRKENKKELRDEIQSAFLLMKAEELEILLNRYGVPAGRLRSIPETVSEEQFKHRSLWNKLKMEKLGIDFSVPSIGFKVNKKPVKPVCPPPEKGEHTTNILNSIGLTESDIKQLRKSNIVN